MAAWGEESKLKTPLRLEDLAIAMAEAVKPTHAFLRTCGKNNLNEYEGIAMKSKKEMSDMAADKKAGIKEGSKRDQKIDKKKGIKGGK